MNVIKYEKLNICYKISINDTKHCKIYITNLLMVCIIKFLTRY